jgi:phosphoglycolate phosphatase
MKRKNIFFDFDGTLVDLISKTEFYQQHYCAYAGLTVWDSKKLSQHYMHPELEDLGWGVPLSEQKKILLDYYNFIRTNYEIIPGMLPETYQNIPDMLDNLYATCGLAIATSRDEHTTHLLLKHNKIDHYFSRVATRTHMENLGQKDKPSGDLVRYIIEQDQLHEHENQFIVVGDTHLDMQMAKDAGSHVIAIGITHGSHDETRLRAAGADHIAHSPADITRIVLAL